jgi:hypothetical protein
MSVLLDTDLYGDANEKDSRSASVTSAPSVVEVFCAVRCAPEFEPPYTSFEQSYSVIS